MAEENELASQEDQVFLGWQIPEYNIYQRGFKWYVASAVVFLVLASLSVFTPNFAFDAPNYLFLIILVVAAAGLILLNGAPQDIDFLITGEGLVIGDKFYDYDDLRNFAIVFKPREDVKSLYFEFKNYAKPRLMIPLGEANPVEVREILASFIDENFERTDESNVDFLSRILKI